MTFHNDSAHVARHEEWRQQLPDYIDQLAAGQDPTSDSPGLTAHLLECPECREDAFELLESLISLYSGQLTIADVAATMPLVIQLQAANQGQTGLIKEATRYVLRFTQSFLDTLRPAQLAGLAFPMAQTATIGEVRGRLLYSYQVPVQSPDDLDLLVKIYADEHAADLSIIDVYLQLPDRSPTDQEGTNIRLQAGSLTVEATTNTCGYASFSRIATADLPLMMIEVVMSGSSL